MLQAYNDWAIDERAAAYPDRFIPLGIVPMWDAELAAAEVRRLGKKGCRSISFLETPHVQGFPELPVGPLGPHAHRHLRRGHGPVAAHRRRLEVIRRPEEADRPPSWVLAARSAPSPPRDLLFGPTLRTFPDLKVALSRAASAGSRSTSTASTATSRTRRGCTTATTSAASGRPRCSRPHPRLLHHRPVRPPPW